VQVDVHRIDAQVAGPHAADDRVEVGAVTVNESARGVDRVGDRLHVALEQAAGVGVGDHHPGDVWAEAGLERGEVHAAFRRRRDRLDRIAGKGRSRRVGAVRALGNEDRLAVALAFRLERGADRQHAAQLAVCAGLGAHRHRVHAGQGDQPVPELVDHRERALHGVDRRERVEVGEARQARDLLVQARVVLHRARAEREEPEVDRVVLPREARVMAHGFGFREAGETDRYSAMQAAEAIRRPSPFQGRGLGEGVIGSPQGSVLFPPHPSPEGEGGEIDARCLGRTDLEDQRLFEHQCAVAGVGEGAAGLDLGRIGAPAARVDGHASTSSRADA